MNDSHVMTKQNECASEVVDRDPLILEIEMHEEMYGQTLSICRNKPFSHLITKCVEFCFKHYKKTDSKFLNKMSREASKMRLMPGEKWVKVEIVFDQKTMDKFIILRPILRSFCPKGDSFYILVLIYAYLFTDR